MRSVPTGSFEVPAGAGVADNPNNEQVQKGVRMTEHDGKPCGIDGHPCTVQFGSCCYTSRRKSCMRVDGCMEIPAVRRGFHEYMNEECSREKVS
jgi:hypothetical protein